jgi:hypothetical protein
LETAEKTPSGLPLLLGDTLSAKAMLPLPSPASGAETLNLLPEKV